MKRGGPLKRTPLKRVSKRRAGELRHYSKARAVFLAAHPFCLCCNARNLNTRKATDIHHKAGRNHAMLNDEAHWLPVCRDCHDTIHRHPAWARAMGFLI